MEKIPSQNFRVNIEYDMSRRMGKPTICIGKITGADQLRGNHEADQSLCFCCTDSTILLLLKSKISSFYLASVTVQSGLCQTWLEPKLLVFSCTDSIQNITVIVPYPEITANPELVASAIG